MKAIWITKHGGPEVLEVREGPDPEPKDGEIRVRTRAVGLNFAEVSARQGIYPDAPKPRASSVTKARAWWTRSGKA